MLGPRLETMIAGMAGKVLLAKVDVDHNSEIAIDYGVCTATFMHSYSHSH